MVVQRDVSLLCVSLACVSLPLIFSVVVVNRIVWRDKRLCFRYSKFPLDAKRDDARLFPQLYFFISPLKLTTFPNLGSESSFIWFGLKICQLFWCSEWKRLSSLRSSSSSSQLLSHQQYFHRHYCDDLGPRHRAPRLCRQRFEELHFVSRALHKSSNKYLLGFTHCLTSSCIILWWKLHRDKLLGVCVWGGGFSSDLRRHIQVGTELSQRSPARSKHQSNRMKETPRRGRFTSFLIEMLLSSYMNSQHRVMRLHRVTAWTHVNTSSRYRSPGHTGFNMF